MQLSEIIFKFLIFTFFFFLHVMFSSLPFIAFSYFVFVAIGTRRELEKLIDNFEFVVCYRFDFLFLALCTFLKKLRLRNFIFFAFSAYFFIYIFCFFREGKK